MTFSLAFDGTFTLNLSPTETSLLTEALNIVELNGAFTHTEAQWKLIDHIRNVLSDVDLLEPTQ